MHTYCINLEKRDDRRRSATSEFEREGFAVEFFPATDGRIDPPRGLYVNPSEYGCSMSHTRVWRDMVENEYPSALVFEDDVRLVPDFVSKSERLPSWNHWQQLYQLPAKGLRMPLHLSLRTDQRIDSLPEFVSNQRVSF